ncbi:fungal-specific transcription factor domain-containing protein [Pseudoneurospora amorphoporcata]|uniref:Fungal-specific transcription factor domain-containing protein n=1 Tax=Pseudoneurospora amorphoporcata TaxID=241081 RepID=A0AAN6NSV7_9PEZI|nr:fungal-specific transcription factor domain-containing protein [Pseudoneurospora amorphoporcata]
MSWATEGNAQPISCLECRRRKQKCNRQFPCNHCSKRGVAHLCRFVPKKANKSDTASDEGSLSVSKKRGFESPNEESYFDENGYQDGENDEADEVDALNALGYMPHTHHVLLGKTNMGTTDSKDEPVQSKELQAAIMSMPAKPYIDCLVDNWLNGANHHYYALYRPQFRTQYDGWWATPPNKRTPELTSLILRVCACSALYILNAGVKDRLERELGTDALTLATTLHTTAEGLSKTIPSGKGGLAHVQQLFLTAFWYKSAEKWTEAWHALGTAIHAAYEIGLHQDSLSDGMSEFDREMRRRLWGILYMWDFALGSMLSRPLLVNHADCTFVEPTLALDKDPESPDKPSPFLHMNLHSSLCLKMAAGFKPVSSDSSIPPEVNKALVSKALRDVVLKWLDELPAAYALNNPDTQWDAENDWIIFQRRYLHLIGHTCLFDPLKQFVTRNSAKPMSDLELELRESGVLAALGLMEVSRTFFNLLVSNGAKFHYAVFCIFDTTTVLCSGLVHDEARNLPYRETVLESIKRGLSMLHECTGDSRTALSLCRILEKMVANLPLSYREKGLMGSTKRVKSKSTSPSASAAGGLEIEGTARQGRSIDSAIHLGEEPRQHSNAGSTVPGEPSPVGNTISVAPEAAVGDDVRPNHAELLLVCGPPAPAPAEAATASWRTTLDQNFQPPMYDMGQINDPGQYGQLDWQIQQDHLNNLDLFNGVQLLPLDGGVPTLLKHWDWEGLDVGNPRLWDSPSPLASP